MSPGVASAGQGFIYVHLQNNKPRKENIMTGRTCIWVVDSTGSEEAGKGGQDTGLLS